MIYFKRGTYFFAVVSRLPAGNVNKIFLRLDVIFSCTNAYKYNLALGGDMNIDMLATTSIEVTFSVLLDSSYQT